MPYDFTKFDTKVTGAREWLAKEFRNIRTGRANPAILDGVQVSAYGSMVPLKQVAQISTEDARTIRVQPYDPSTIKDIERAISTANLGVGTSADSAGVRVTFPELTGERRQELVKMAKGKLEEARATIRVARDEAQRGLAADAMHHLGDAALVHAVLGPRAGKVLHTADLDGGHTAGHVPHTVAMGVSGGVGDDARVALGHGGQRIA